MSVNIFQNNALKKIAGNYAIDSSLSTTSDNAVQNKVVTSAINDINSKVGTGTLDVGSDCVSGINTLNTQLNEKATYTIATHGYITSYLSAKRVGNKMHLTGLFLVTATIPRGTDFLYINGNVVSDEASHVPMVAIGGTNNSMYINSGSNHFTSEYDIAAGTYNVDCWYACKVN